MKFSEGYSFGFTTNSSSNWSPVAPHRGMRRSVQWLPFFICWALCPVLTGTALPHLTTLGGCFPPLYRRRQVRDVESFAQDRLRHATSERWKWDSNPRVAAEPEHRSSRPRSVPVKLSTARQCQERLEKSALWVAPPPAPRPLERPLAVSSWESGQPSATLQRPGCCLSHSPADAEAGTEPSSVSSG